MKYIQQGVKNRVKCHIFLWRFYYYLITSFFVIVMLSLFILLRGEQKYSCICDIKAICIAFYYTKSIYPDGEHIQTRLRYTTQIFLCWERIKGPHIIVIYISHTQQDKCLDKVLYGRIQFFISHFENEIVVPLYTFFANK